MKFKPTENRVVAKVIQKEQNRSGFYIPEQSSENALIRAEIIALGTGLTLSDGTKIDPCIKVGDVILCKKSMGTVFKYKEETYIIIRESDLLTTIEDVDEEDLIL